MRINEHPSQVYLAEITQDKNKSNAFDTRQNLPSAQDSVSISTEAFTLAQEMYIKNKTDFAKYMEEDASTATSSMASTKGIDTSPTLKEIYHSYLYNSKGKRNKSVGANGSSSPESDLEQKIGEIEKKIKELQGQIESVASSDMPEVAKAMRVSGLQKEISSLLIQKSSLQSGTKTSAISTRPK